MDFRNVTKEQEKEICDKYANGMTMRGLANMYSVSTNTIGDILTFNNVRKRAVGGKKPSQVLAEKKRAIYNDYMRGITSTDILCRKYDVTSALVYKALTERGVSKRVNNSKRDKEIANALISGETYTEIAKRYGLSKARIGVIAKENIEGWESKFAPSRKRADAIFQEYLAGATNQQLANKYGLSRQRVSQIIIKNKERLADDNTNNHNTSNH